MYFCTLLNDFKFNIFYTLQEVIKIGEELFNHMKYKFNLKLNLKVYSTN